MKNIELSAARHALSARAALAAFHGDVEQGAGVSPVEVTVLLANLAAIGAVLPHTLSLLSEHLATACSVTELNAESDAEDISQAFTVQVAQHYLDQTRIAVTEAAAYLEHAVNALGTLDPTV